MELKIRKGTMADTEAFLSLLHSVKENMVSPEWFYLDPDEDVYRMMEAGTMALWVAMDGNRLAGAFSIVYPGLDRMNYGYDLNLTEQDLMMVVHMDTAVVDPDYRGLGLQRKLTAEVERYLSGKGKRILLSTVHPDNRYSLQNMLKSGYEIRTRTEKYGSVRYVTCKYIY